MTWQVCGAGLGNAVGFGEAWRAEVLVGKVIGEIW